MDPIPIFFDNVKRSALVVRPKQPFFDWLKSIDPEDDSIELQNASDVYLLPDFEDVTHMKKWLKKEYDRIFSDQLNNWYIDESLWVNARTFEMFEDWFEYSLHPMVWDTEDGFIEKV